MLSGLRVDARDAAMVGDDHRDDIDGALATGFKEAVWLARPPIEHHSGPRVAVVRGPGQVLSALDLLSHRVDGRTVNEARLNTD